MLYDNNKINNIISMEQIPVLHHRDDTASRIGMPALSMVAKLLTIASLSLVERVRFSVFMRFRFW